MALFSCCCTTPQGCTLNTSTGFAVVGAWKLDATAAPAASQPHCRYFRTLTLTVADSFGATVATIVLRHTIDQGGFADDQLFAQGPIATISGANPCAGAPSPNFGLGLGPITNRTETGMTQALTGINGCTFSGSVRYEFSEEVFLADMEATAALLASLVDWPTFPTDKSQSVYYVNGTITTGLTSAQSATAWQPNWCGNNNGLFGVSGTGSWIVYRPTFPRPPGFEWFPLTSMGPTGNWPYLNVRGKSWTSRMIIPGRWCEYTGSLVRDANGFPTRCNISSLPVTCGTVISGVQHEAGGTIIFPPAASMRYLRVGCGIGATCA